MKHGTQTPVLRCSRARLNLSREMMEFGLPGSIGPPRGLPLGFLSFDIGKSNSVVDLGTYDVFLFVLTVLMVIAVLNSNLVGKSSVKITQ